MYRGLSGFSANFYIVDHFDRWAVLLDKIIRDGMNEERNVKLSIVQHGILNLNFQRQDSLPFDLMFKLKNVSHVYAYDECSLSIFKNHIFEKCKFTYVLKPPEIQLEKIGNNKINILFVGHEICKKYHECVFLELKKCLISTNINFLYKPHPTQNQIIDGVFASHLYGESLKFPDVDIVVSYPSTLGYEYSLLGKTVVFHDLDENVSQSYVVVNEVLNKLKRLESV